MFRKLYLCNKITLYDYTKIKYNPALAFSLDYDNLCKFYLKTFRT